MTVRNNAVAEISRRFAGESITTLTTEDIYIALHDVQSRDPKVNAYIDKVVNGHKSGITRLQRDVARRVQSLYKIPVIDSDTPNWIPR